MLDLTKIFVSNNMAKSKPFNASPHSVFTYGAREFAEGSSISVKQTLTAYCKRKNMFEKFEAKPSGHEMEHGNIEHYLTGGK
jgi:hypothetical protein